ncbi:basic proline-rich protein-like [Mustela putorius furo]|uniref:Basic proline-rich protein-like n=1 Tax=Mustela putorius furo TaxID=9669 RepID=A0A8U0RGX7_MUSPF|nr:basic proline-rich protein-like [Mustela putorius furo]
MLPLLLGEGPGRHRPSAPGPQPSPPPPHGISLPCGVGFSRSTPPKHGGRLGIPVPDPQGIRTPRSAPPAVPGVSQVAAAVGAGHYACGEAQRAPARVSEAPGSGLEPIRGSILARAGDTLFWCRAQNPSHAPPVPAPASVRTPREASLTPRPPSAQEQRTAAAARPAGTRRGVNSEVHLPRPGDGGVPGTGPFTAASSDSGQLPREGRSRTRVIPRPRVLQANANTAAPPFPSIGPEATVHTSRSHPRHPDHQALPCLGHGRSQKGCLSPGVWPEKLTTSFLPGQQWIFRPTRGKQHPGPLATNASPLQHTPPPSPPPPPGSRPRGSFRSFPTCHSYQSFLKDTNPAHVGDSRPRAKGWGPRLHIRGERTGTRGAPFFDLGAQRSGKGCHLCKTSPHGPRRTCSDATGPGPQHRATPGAHSKELGRPVGAGRRRAAAAPLGWARGPALHSSDGSLTRIRLQSRGSSRTLSPARPRKPAAGRQFGPPNPALPPRPPTPPLRRPVLPCHAKPQSPLSEVKNSFKEILLLSGYIRRSPPSKPTKRNLLRPRRWGGRAGERGEGGTLESAGPPAATGRRSRAHPPAAEAPAALRRRSPSSLRPGTELRRRYHPGAHARPASPQSRTPARLGHPPLPFQAAWAACHRRPRSHNGHGLPTRWGTRKVLGPGRATQTRPPAPSPGSPPGRERKEDKGQGAHLAEAARRQQRPSCTPYGSLGVPRGHRRISSPE